MLFGQDGKQLVLLQKDRVQLGGGGQGKETAVGASSGQQGFDGGAVPGQQFVFDAGAIALEFAQDIGEPMRSGGGDRSDPEPAGLQAAQTVDLGLDRLIGFAKPLRVGEQSLPVRGQPHACAAPFQQRELPLGFKIGDHAADPGLGIGKRLRRLGEAAEFHGLDKCKMLLNVHVQREHLLIHANAAWDIGKACGIVMDISSIQETPAFCKRAPGKFWDGAQQFARP